MRLVALPSAFLLAACGLDTVPDGPPNFQAGYKDGCETGYAGGGMTLFFKFTRDVEAYDQDALYRQGWEAGFQYCNSQQNTLNSMPAPDGDEAPRRDDAVTGAPYDEPHRGPEN